MRRRRELGAALRELNAKAGLGVTAEDLDRAEAYATGALVEAEMKIGDASRLAGRELMWFECGTVDLGNLTGAPALSVPCGDGMPVGLQLYGHAFGEEGLLAFGHAYEQATDWHRRRPPTPC